MTGSVVPHGARQARRRETAIHAASEIGSDFSALPVDAMASNTGEFGEQLLTTGRIHAHRGPHHHVGRAGHARIVMAKRVIIA